MAAQRGAATKVAQLAVFQAVPQVSVVAFYGGVLSGRHALGAMWQLPFDVMHFSTCNSQLQQMAACHCKWSIHQLQPPLPPAHLRNLSRSTPGWRRSW